MQQDTIFALSTPPGKSGVAVIRLSGVQSAPLFLALTQRQTIPPPRQAILSTLYDHQSHVLDRALFLYFKAPHSFTGEDMLEIHTHGGMAIINGLLRELERHYGVRPAEPGEFMRRAFYNDKADLLEAEAIADMIDAETAQQLRQATCQMQGEHSEYYHNLRQNILEILALLEAYIDFPEEELPEDIFREVLVNIDKLAQQIESSLDDNAAGQRLRSGFRISIAGAPNVGKSTLLNALAGRKAAIVSSQAGTTRDIIELPMDISGYPVLLCDTAGIHETEEEVEKLGIQLSHQSLKISDINILMVDATNFEASLEQARAIHQSELDGSAILVINKTDTLSEEQASAMARSLASDYPEVIIVFISAKQKNLAELEAALSENLSQLMPGENSWITRSRHRILLAEAKKHLMADYTNLPIELCCEEIRLAASSIGKITGKIIADDLLEVIFSRFCIGK